MDHGAALGLGDRLDRLGDYLAENDDESPNRSTR
jgi:hypothetical protein